MLVKDLDVLFKYSISISCDKKRATLQKIAFKYVGLPETTVFQALTPTTIITNTYQDTILLTQFLNYIQPIHPTIVNNIITGKVDNKVCLSMSAKLAVFKAKLLNWPYILIFEDDAWPNKFVVDQLINGIIQLNNIYIKHPEVEVFIIGYNKLLVKHCKRINYPIFFYVPRQDNYIYKTQFYGSHAYFIPNTAFDKFLGLQYNHCDLMLAQLANKAFAISAYNFFIQAIFAGWRETKNINSNISNKAYIYKDIYVPSIYKLPVENIYQSAMLSFEDLNIPNTYDEYISNINNIHK